MSKLSSKSVRQLYQEAASTAPSPGGGSVTALCGMLGVALILKAVRISLRHGDDAELAAADPVLERLGDRLDVEADADAASFADYIAASRLPRVDEEEARLRTERLDAAGAVSVEVALRTLDVALEAIAFTRSLQGRISEIMGEDIAAGLQLLETARLTAMDNARASLSRIVSAEVRGPLQRRLEAASA